VETVSGSAADSGATALEALKQLKLRNDPVALFLVDQRMPQMSGVEFLEGNETLPGGEGVLQRMQTQMRLSMPLTASRRITTS